MAYEPPYTLIPSRLGVPKFGLDSGRSLLNVLDEETIPQKTGLAVAEVRQ
ncbi:MAG: hypothetical protein V7K88_05020 [Nostoc sp.]